MFGNGAHVFHCLASRNLPQSVLREHHVSFIWWWWFGVFFLIFGLQWVFRWCFFIVGVFCFVFSSSPSHALTPTGKPDLSGLVGSEWIFICASSFLPDQKSDYLHSIVL